MSWLMTRLRQPAGRPPPCGHQHMGASSVLTLPVQGSSLLLVASQHYTPAEWLPPTSALLAAASSHVDPGLSAGELSPTAWSPASTGPQQNGYSPLHPGTRHIVASSGELPPSLHATAQGQESPLAPLFAAAVLSAPVPAGVAAGAAARLPDGSLQQSSKHWRGCPADGWPAQALQVNESFCLTSLLLLLLVEAVRDPAPCASTQCACMLSRAQQTTAADWQLPSTMPMSLLLSLVQYSPPFQCRP